MNCPRCRGVAPAGVSFCPHCGNDLRLFQQAPTQAAQVPVKEQLKKAANGPAGYFQPQTTAGAIPLPQKKSKLPWILAATALLLLIGSGFVVLNMLKKTGEDPSKMLQKNGNLPGPMLKKVGDEKPYLGKTGENPPPAPEPDLRWLYHLEKIEKRRGELAKKGLAKFMVMAQPGQFGTDMNGLNQLTTGDPEANMPDSAPDMISAESAEAKKEWAKLREDFDSFPPPPDCVTIAEPYGHAMDETRAMMTDVMDAITVSKEDPQKALASLYGMQNKSKSIDEFGNLADERVQALCSKYNKRKWFSVNSDFGNSSIFGSLGIK
jgi:hypothetical protein